MVRTQEQDEVNLPLPGMLLERAPDQRYPTRDHKKPDRFSPDNQPHKRWGKK